MAKFEKSVEATIPALRRYARALTQDSEIADDLVHNTLLQAIRSKRQFHGGVVLGWLYAVLTDLNSDRLRLSARQPALSSSKNDFSPDVAEQDAGSDIESALSSLVDDQRTALLLPEIAVVQVGDRTFVYRVKPDGSVEQADVQVGARNEGKAEILRGIAAGDRIVVDGTGKLRPGAKIVDAANAPRAAKR